MSRHIGIVGCSAEGAALCYRTICLEAEPLMGRHAHPEVTLHTISLADYMRLIERNGAGADWRGVAELMLRSAEKLKCAGANFLICPDNTIHQALPYVLPRSPLPWLHIAEEVGREAQRRGFANLALTGTKFLVESEVYPEKLDALGIGWQRPKPDARERTNVIIFDELVRGIQRLESLFYMQQLIENMKIRGCDAVVLGCTELPLLISDEDSPLPTLDSTRLLARAALRRAVGK
jgi:aspartate racemase